MNASQLLAFDTRAAQTGEALWPATVTIGGTDYAACAPKPRTVTIDVPGATSVSGDLIVRIRKTVLVTPPALDETIRAHDQEWVVREVRANEGSDACWMIRAEPKN